MDSIDAQTAEKDSVLRRFIDAQTAEKDSVLKRLRELASNNENLRWELGPPSSYIQGIQTTIAGIIVVLQRCNNGISVDLKDPINPSLGDYSFLVSKEEPTDYAFLDSLYRGVHSRAKSSTLKKFLMQ